MASLSGVSRNNTLSSLMNSANMISGLASGMDTEGMIENLVKSYQMKINQLNQKVTKVGWKQDAYRSIISKMVSLADKYTSYTSSTNLMSRGFFNSAVTVSALGKYADAVSASGKTSSDVSINAVRQLATAARYRTTGNMDYGDGKSIEASAGLDLDGKTELGTLSGSMTLTYGNQKVSISFDQVADVKAMEEIKTKLAKDNYDGDEDKVSNAEVLAELINQKLSGQTINLTGGKAVDANERIEVTAADGKISFKDKSSAGNSVFVSGASGNVGVALGISGALNKEDKDKPRSIYAPDKLTTNVDNKTYLSGKSMNLNLDGVTKSITMPQVYSEAVLDENGEAVLDENEEPVMKYYLMDGDGNKLFDENDKPLEYNAENYTKVLSDAVDKAFGGKVKVSNTATDGSLKLRFDVQEGSTLVVNTDVGEALGIGRTATSYLNTNKTLGELLGEDVLSKLTPTGEKDKYGNDLYAFEINGVKVGSYSKDSKLSDLMNDINNSDAGVKLTYSQTTKKFTFDAKETGADSKVKLGGGLASAMFGANGNAKVSEVFKGLDLGENGKVLRFGLPGGNATYEFKVTKDMTVEDIVKELQESGFGQPGVDGYSISYDKTTGQFLASKDGTTKVFEVSMDGKDLEYQNYTAGQDAIFNVTVNGETMNMTRSSNTVNIDGLTVTMKEEFDATVDENGDPVKNVRDAVTFKTSTDSDKIVDVIKELVNDYNVMMAEIKSAYSTLPYQNSSGAFGDYEPLTEEDMEGMTESAITRYEEKAKQGILFGDRTLSTLYDKLNQVFSFNNKADVDTLKDMGITVSYSISGGTQAVTIDENKLRAMLDSDPDRVADLFTKTDGVMDRMKTQLDNYAKTTGEPKGILIQQAGSPLSSLSLLNNFWQQEIDNYTTQIEKWQTKLESQVERYTSQFARLEQLIAQMNNQSSTLAGLMGGY